MIMMMMMMGCDYANAGATDVAEVHMVDAFVCTGRYSNMPIFRRCKMHTNR